LIEPLPPSPSAARHESLSRRNRRSGKLSISRFLFQVEYYYGLQ